MVGRILFLLPLLSVSVNAEATSPPPLMKEKHRAAHLKIGKTDIDLDLRFSRPQSAEQLSTQFASTTNVLLSTTAKNAKDIDSTTNILLATTTTTAAPTTHHDTQTQIALVSSAAGGSSSTYATGFIPRLMGTDVATGTKIEMSQTHLQSPSTKALTFHKGVTAGGTSTTAIVLDRQNVDSPSASKKEADMTATKVQTTPSSKTHPTAATNTQRMGATKMQTTAINTKSLVTSGAKGDHKEVMVSDSDEERKAQANNSSKWGSRGSNRIVVVNDPQNRKAMTLVTENQWLTEAHMNVVDAYDNNGESLRVEDVDESDTAVKQCLVSPLAEKVTFNPYCADGQRLFVNGKKYANGADITFKRDKTRHTQIVEMVCKLPAAKKGSHLEQKYAVLINSDWPQDEIKPPRLILDELGAECHFDEKKGRYNCPDPKSPDGKIRLLSYNEPTIKYVLENRDKSVQIRLTDKGVTTPFHYAGSFSLQAEAGENSQEWPVSFGGSMIAPILNGVGWLLALLLALLIGSLLCVVGIASVSGLGVPRGATEIAAGLTLLIQYLSFSNFLRGTTTMESLATPLKWVTLFWPTPFETENAPPRQLLSTTHFSTAYGVKLWGSSTLGDITDIRNAWGCIFWCFAALLIVMTVHGAVYTKFMTLDKEYTMPHHISWGNWESRTIHFITFPLAVSSMMTLLADESGTGARIASGLALTFLAGWIATVFFSVSSAVTNQDVCWIWNSSIRQAGGAEDLSGYWADVTSDQLLTQIVNRSLCSSIFPYEWVSTVADIVPLSLPQSLFSASKNSSGLYAPDKLHKGHQAASYPLAKNPQVVEVIKTRHANCGFEGHRLAAGLLRTKWLDMLMTFQAMTLLYTSAVVERGSAFSVSLIVKTAQLSGPITHGKDSFFYDGARIPFIRVADAIYRLLIGVALGTAMVSDNGTNKAMMFGTISLLSFAFAVYVAATSPYSRKPENFGTVALLSVIGCTAFAFIFYSLKEQTMASDFFLWLLVLLCMAFAAYAAMVTFCVFGAVMCPPLPESRFLEKLANCSVSITDVNNGWECEVPAYSKYAAQDLKQQSKSGRVRIEKIGSLEEITLEFTVKEIRQACKTGQLSVP